MTCIIGLTGGISSGKSTVSSIFKELKIPVIDADIISRDIVEPEEEAYNKIVSVFGKEILLPDLTLDRKKLGAIIFSDNKKREQLNNITHPEVRKKMIEERDHYIETGEKCVVLDIPLLFENNLSYLVDQTIVVYVDEDIQIERLMHRDQSTFEEANKRIMSQIPMREKAKLADVIINNNGTIDNTYKQLIKTLIKWQIVK